MITRCQSIVREHILSMTCTQTHAFEYDYSVPVYSYENCLGVICFNKDPLGREGGGDIPLTDIARSG